MQPHPAETRHLHEVIKHGNLQPQTQTKVLLAALQAMRTIEIARVRSEDVDFVAMKLRIMGKGNSDITVDLHPDVPKYARQYPHLFPLRGWWFLSPTKPGVHTFPVSVSKMLSEACRRTSNRAPTSSLERYRTGPLGRSYARDTKSDTPLLDPNH